MLRPPICAGPGLLLLAELFAGIPGHGLRNVIEELGNLHFTVAVAVARDTEQHRRAGDARELENVIFSASLTAMEILSLGRRLSAQRTSATPPASSAAPCFKS